MQFSYKLVCLSILIQIKGQNKVKGHISKNVAKMAILWPKIGQRHFGARALHGHNLAIFDLIWTNEYTKMTSSISLLLVFGPHFAPRPHMGNVVHMDSKLPSNCWNMSWPSWPTHISITQLMFDCFNVVQIIFEISNCQGFYVGENKLSCLLNVIYHLI